MHDGRLVGCFHPAPLFVATENISSSYYGDVQVVLRKAEVQLNAIRNLSLTAALSI